jgi:DNA-binding NtrC family response regulator
MAVHMSLVLDGKIMNRSLKGTLETILVVDNDEAVREVVVSILKRAHFRVLSAHGGVDAINLAEETAGKIHLLLSEVDVPQMSGPDLGQALKMSRPDIHVMLMSGRENGNLLVLNYGWAYIHKPLVATKLVQMIKDVLHSADRSQIGGQEFESSKDTSHKDVNPAAHSAVRTTAESDDSPKAPPLDAEISRVVGERAAGGQQAH